MVTGDQPYWKFKQYPLTDNKGAIDKWRKKCKEYDDYADLEFETTVNTLAAMKRELWTDPEYKARGFSIIPYKKMTSWEDIGELRFTNAAKTPLRVFGFFREEVGEFVMLAGAVEDNKKYDPADIRNICVDRKQLVERGRDTPIDFDFLTEDKEEDEDGYLRALIR